MATQLNVAYIKTKGSNTFDVLRVGATGNLEYASVGILGLTTSNVAEGSNLYYTNTRVYANVIPLLDLKANVVDLTTSNVVEGTNLYYTNTRVYANVIPLLDLKANVVDLTTSNVIEGTNLYYSNTRANAAIDNRVTKAFIDNLGISGSSAVFAENANVANTVLSISNFTTANLIEGANLYYTNARVYANVIGILNDKANVVDLTTANVSELNNLYYTNARVYANVISLLPNYTGNLTAANATIGGTSGGFITGANLISTNIISATTWTGLYASNVVGLTTANVAEINNLYYTNARVYANVIGLLNDRANIGDLTTSNVVEGANLYYTNARVRSTLSSGTGVSYDNTTGQISIGQNVDTHANVTFNELTITGNLNVVGNLVGFYANTLVINDPLIQLGYNNPSDSIDLGFLGHYNDSGTERHAGLFRDASDKKFKFFANIVGEQGPATIDTANDSFRLATVVAETFEGNVTGFVSSIGNFTTSDLTEGNQLYYTNARVDAYVTPKLTTANVAELTNLYYTNARVYSNVIGLIGDKANVSDLTTANVSELTNLYYTNARVYSNVISLLNAKANVADLTTANVSELTNLYYTNARVYSNVIGLIGDKANVSDLTTANVLEVGNNIFYTNARVYSNVISLLNAKANVSDLTTANVLEVGNNIFYTNARVIANVLDYFAVNEISSNVAAALVNFGSNIINTTGNIAAGNIIVNTVTSNIWTNLYTANVLETSGNLYYTNTRVLSNVLEYLAVNQTSSNVAAALVNFGSNIINTTGNITAGNVFANTIIGNGGGFIVGANLISTNIILATTWTGLYAANVVGLTTANVLEVGSNIYYTNARVLSNVLEYLAVNQTSSNVAAALINFGSNIINTTGNITAGNVIANNFIQLGTGTGAITSTSNLNITAAGNINLLSGNVVISNRVIVGGATSNIVIDGNTGNISVTNTLTTNNLIIRGFELFSNNDISLNRVTANIWNNLYTGNVIENPASGNLWYSNARVLSNILAYIAVNPQGTTYTNSNVTHFMNIFGSNSIVTTGNITAGNIIVTTNLTVRGTLTANAISANSGGGFITGANLISTNTLAVGRIQGVVGAGGITGNIHLTANVMPQGNGLINLGNATNYFGNVYAKVVWSTELRTSGKTLYIGDTEISVDEDNNLVITNPNGATITLRGNFSSNTDLTTTNVTELINLYYTNDRVYSNVTEMLPTYTGNIRSGNITIGYGTGGSLIGANLITTNIISATTWTGLYSSNVVEGTNLFYTNARVSSNVIALLPTLAGPGINIAANGIISTSTSAPYAADIIGLNTANVAETTNLYYTNARVYSNVIALLPTLAGPGINIAANGIISSAASVPYATDVIGLNTANVAETTNLYYTNARVHANVIGLLNEKANVTDLTTSNVTEGNNLYYSNDRVYANVIGLLNAKANVADLTTANVAELNNLYYTNARVYSNVIVLLPNYTGNISAGNIFANSIYGGSGGSITGANLISTNIISATTWIGITAANVTGLTTANVLEVGSNIYYTNARVHANVIGLLNEKANVTDLTTSNVAELNNLYYTNARVSSNVIALLPTLAGPGINIAANGIISSAASVPYATDVIGLNTANVAETTNLYYTNARVSSNVIALLPTLAGPGINIAANGIISTSTSNPYATDVIGLNTANVAETTNLYYTNARVYANVIGLLDAKANVVDLTTANVAELNNLYYTNARVRTAVSAGTGVIYDNTTGIISIGQNVDTAANVTFGTVNVTGNLNVFGNVVGFYANTLVVNDPLIQLGYNNPSDSIDLGFISHYNDSGTERHAGLFRDATDKKFKFFDNYSVEPGASVIDTANISFRLANVVATTFEGNVVGNVTGFVSSIGNFSTTDLNEGTNLYYTNARVYANVISLLPQYNGNLRVGNLVVNGFEFFSNNDISVNRITSNIWTNLYTANVLETASNLYYTNARVYANVISLLPNYTGNLRVGNLIVNGFEFFSNNDILVNRVTSNIWGGLFAANVIGLTTANVREFGSNVYYSNARARTAIVAGNGISYSNVTGVISLNNLVVSDTAPTSPYNGQVWVDTNYGTRYEYIDDGTSAQWVEFGSGGGGGGGSTGLSSRTTVTGTTASIAANITANIQISGFKGYALYKIGVTNNAWVRVYTTQAARLADASRSSGTDPSANAGVIAEIITTGNSTISLSPAVMGYNDEATPNTSIAVAVTNLTTGTTSFTVSLTLVQLES